MPETKPKATGQSANALSKGELAHLEWMSKLDDDLADEELAQKGKENSSGNTQRERAIASSTRAIPEESSEPPARGWLVIHGGDFAKVAKNLPAFRHLFMRSVSTALGIPMGCVEVVNVTRGSVVVEFLLRPSGRGSDTRGGEELKEAFAQQLSLSHSALRKGPFKDYVASAELVDRSQQKIRTVGDLTATAPQAREIKPSPTASIAKATLDVSSAEKLTPQETDILAAAQARIKELEAENAKLKKKADDAMKDIEDSEAEARRCTLQVLLLEKERDDALKELAQLRGQAQ
jgi:hypothetical protein